MSDELLAPASVPAPVAPVEPVLPAVPLVPAPPAPEPAPEPSVAVAAVEHAAAESDKADASLVREVVEWTHHTGVSLLHGASAYVEIPADATHGARIEQILGR